MAIRLVVFDVAGTTVRDGGAVRRAMREAIAAAGLDLRDAAMDGVSGMAKPRAIRTLLEGHGREELVPRVDAIHADFVARLARQIRAGTGIAPVDGAVETFGTLRRAGIRTALDTGFDREALDLVLGHVGWSIPGTLDAAVASDEVARGRPYPDMIDALRARLGAIPSADVAKVGDTPVDLHEGAMARCGLVVGVLSGAHRRDTLESHPHDALLDSVAGLPALLAERGLLP